MIKPKFWKRIKSQSEMIFQSPFLKRMSQLERYEFLQLSHRRRFKAGEYVYHQGDPGTGLYMIEQGGVELLYQEEHTDNAVQLAVLHAPESFGAFSVEYLVKRKASARCATDAVIYGFFISDYQTLGKRHPRIALRFLETLNVFATRQLDLVMTRMSQIDDDETGAEAYALLFETYDIPAEESAKDKIS
ncbi:MAG: cyclic nucleotide-binding domain-containing protein [Balneolaceae bacterium]|nr:MAG: cyclic nucleotide-binding domain-containing protein [Balneolaceae bacterium]